MIAESRVTAVRMNWTDVAMSWSSSASTRARVAGGTSPAASAARRSSHESASSLLNPWRLTSGDRRSCETLKMNISFSRSFSASDSAIAWKTASSRLSSSFPPIGSARVFPSASRRAFSPSTSTRRANPRLNAMTVTRAVTPEAAAPPPIARFCVSQVRRRRARRSASSRSSSSRNRSTSPRNPSAIRSRTN